jgi:hypothetical protein
MMRRFRWVLLGSALSAIVSLSGCNRDSDTRSVALDAEAPTQHQPVRTDAVPDPLPEQVPKAEDLSPATQPTIPIPEMPSAVVPAAEPIPVVTKPEESGTAALDPQGIDGVETLIAAQRDDIDQLKISQTEIHRLIENLRAELHRSIQARTKVRPISADPFNEDHSHSHVRTTHSRRRVKQVSPTPPFSVESVDSWGNEKHVVLRTPAGRLDLKVGEGYAGWIVQDDSDGTAASFRDPGGREARMAVTW